MKNRLISTLMAITVATASVAASKNYELTSPDGRLKVTVETGEEIGYSLEHDGDLLMKDSHIGMYMTDGTVFGGMQPVRKMTRRNVSTSYPAILYKKAEVKDEFNEVTLKFKKFSLVFRAYDDGMAYRFLSHVDGAYEVEKELADFNFAKDWNMWAAYVCQHTETLDSQYYNSFENRYEYTPLSQWNQDRLAFLPLMVDGPDGKKIVITEADMMDYPGMYLYNSDSDACLESRVAPYPVDGVIVGNVIVQLAL